MDGMELYAWIGENELPEYGLSIKRILAPTGCIPLVALRREKAEAMKTKMEAEAKLFGRKVRLVKFVVAEIVAETEAGD